MRLSVYLKTAIPLGKPPATLPIVDPLPCHNLDSRSFGRQFDSPPTTSRTGAGGSFVAKWKIGSIDRSKGSTRASVIMSPYPVTDHKNDSQSCMKKCSSSEVDGLP